MRGKGSGSKGSGGDSSGLGAGAAAVAGGVLLSTSDGGNGNIGCPESDKSFYCQLSRTTKIVQMLLILLIIFICILFLIGFLYKTYYKKK